MSEHTCTTITPGCYRCDLGQDEMAAAIALDQAMLRESAKGIRASNPGIEWADSVADWLDSVADSADAPGSRNGQYVGRTVSNVEWDFATEVAGAYEDGAA